jgi:hypothetical protein
MGMRAVTDVNGVARVVRGIAGQRPEGREQLGSGRTPKNGGLPGACRAIVVHVRNRRLA